MNIDALTRAVGHLKDAIVPGDPARAEQERYALHLMTLSDEELEEELYRVNPELRPTLSREELIQSFLSIDIDSVPASLLRPDEQLSKVDYRNLQMNHIERGRVTASTIEQLQRWHTWKEQVYG